LYKYITIFLHFNERHRATKTSIQWKNNKIYTLTLASNSDSDMRYIPVARHCTFALYHLTKSYKTKRITLPPKIPTFFKTLQTNKYIKKPIPYQPRPSNGHIKLLV